MQLRCDVELLVRAIKNSYTGQILALLSSSPDNVAALVRESLSLGSQSLLTTVPALTDVLTEALTEKCVEVRVTGTIALFIVALKKYIAMYGNLNIHQRHDLF